MESHSDFNCLSYHAGGNDELKPHDFPKMESSFTPVTIVEQDLVDLWRTVAVNRNLGDDADVARFLISS
jgi:hypothetical protein